MKLLSPIRAWLLDDIGWKLFSLLLAVAIWLTAHRVLQGTQPSGFPDTNPVTYGNIPVYIVSNSDIREYRLLQPTISVTVSGPAEAIGKLQANQIHAVVYLADPSTVNSGKQRVEVAVPPGIIVQQVHPESVGIIAPPPKE